MPQEFKAIVSYTKDTTQYIERDEGNRINPRVLQGPKGAEFGIVTAGPCPWPPHQLIGKKVRVIIED